MDEQMLPLVSVVTPVYNGEIYLAECIDSVLSQSYTNWEYVIVNNCSTDRTLDIATDYAARDKRIHIHNNEAFLPIIGNWNHALRQLSPHSKYCKIVHADDVLLADCVQQMVTVAEANPSVGIVGSYRIVGTRVNLDGLPYPSPVVGGFELGRSALNHIGRLGGLWLFGSPTSTLLRADLIRSRDSFYNEANLHADAEVCLDLLQGADFGFVHQVLTYTRIHDDAVTPYTNRMQTHIPSEFLMLKNYGPIFLSPDENQLCLRNKLVQYYVFLARSVLRRKDREFWAFHRQKLKELGYPLNWFRLAAYTAVEIVSKGVNLHLTRHEISDGPTGSAMR